MKKEHRPNIANVLLDIYRLLTIFASSKAIAELEVSPSYGADPLQGFEEFEQDEITRILLSVAITVRVVDDREAKMMDLLAEHCGELVKDIDKPSDPIALQLRQACNKIVHANKIECDEDTLSNGKRILRHRIRFFGTDQDGRSWHAGLDVVRFCRESSAMLRLLSRETNQ